MNEIAEKIWIITDSGKGWLGYTSVDKWNTPVPTTFKSKNVCSIVTLKVGWTTNWLTWQGKRKKRTWRTKSSKRTSRKRVDRRSSRAKTDKKVEQTRTRGNSRQESDGWDGVARTGQRKRPVYSIHLVTFHCFRSCYDSLYLNITLQMIQTTGLSTKKKQTIIVIWKNTCDGLVIRTFQHIRNFFYLKSSWRKIR